MTYRGHDSDVRPETVKFANRLSDLLFVLARTEEFEASIREAARSILEKNKVADGKSDEPVNELDNDPKSY